MNLSETLAFEPPVPGPVFEPVDIFALREGMCACLVPVPGIFYCGLPVARGNPFRMCETHASAYLNKGTKNESKSFTKSRSSQRLVKV